MKVEVKAKSQYTVWSNISVGSCFQIPNNVRVFMKIYPTLLDNGVVMDSVDLNGAVLHIMKTDEQKYILLEGSATFTPKDMSK